MTRFAVVALALFCSVGILQGAAACSFDSSKNCAANVNTGCDQCKLYEVASAPTGSCKTGRTDLCKTMGSLTTIQIAQPDAQSKKSHWKIVPSDAIRGVEDINSFNDAKFDQLWRDGGSAFSTKNLPSSPPVPTNFNPGFFINSPSGRTQHQLHIHIAPLKQSPDSVYKILGISKPKSSGPQWTEHKTAQQAKSVYMQCPKSGTTLAPFTQFVNGYSSKSFPQIQNPHEDASILVFKPSWCKGGNTCDFCQFVMYHVGDQEVLDY